jgi:hypothetical protein
MSVEVVEVTIKCRVPHDEVDDFIVQLRRGERRLPVPEGLTCRDAFDCHEAAEPGVSIIRAGYW